MSSRPSGSDAQSSRRRANLPDTPDEDPQTAALRRRLTGCTLAPATATAIVAEAEARLAARRLSLQTASACPGEIRFDGTGRIVAIKPGTLSPALAARLEAAVIEPLSKTRSEVPAQAPRPARSILTAAMHLLRHDESPEASSWMDSARKLFFAGSLTRDVVSASLDDAATRLQHHQTLGPAFERLAAESSKPVTTPQLVDNLYGRTFESLLVEDLVRDPPQGVLAAAKELGRGVLDILGSLPGSKQSKLVEGIASQTRADWRIWYGLSPTMKAFARTPSMETLAKCLSDTTTGIEAIKVPFLATHMCRTLNTHLPSDMPAWLHKADAFYESDIYPRKPQTTSMLSDGNRGGLEARIPGNRLHYQPGTTAFEMQGQAGGKSCTHARVVDAHAAEPDAPKGFVKDALTRGQTVVTGPSGQTNLLAFFGQHLADVNPRFSLGDHHLNTLMALVFDGGHSTEEVLHTIDAIEKSSRSWIASLAATLSCSLDAPLKGYEAIATLAENSSDELDLRKRLDKALDMTLDFHAEQVARS